MKLNQIWRGRTLAVLAVALGVVLGASHAGASPLSTVPPIVTVAVTSGYDYYDFTGEATDTGDGSLGISGVGERPEDFRCEWAFTVDPDPMVMGTFTLTNLAATAQPFTMSATLGVAPIPVTDQDGRLRRRRDRHRLERQPAPRMARPCSRPPVPFRCTRR